MQTNNSNRFLWYFADPMCSWCWGFTPVMDEIKKCYADRLNIALILGGLRPGSTDSLTPALRAEILHHWHEVHSRTGQAFNFEGAMPEGFIYNTEPPSRAVVTMGSIKPDAVFAYFKAIQAAFYVDQKDTTQQSTLLELASQFGVDIDVFQVQFQTEELKNKTFSHFQKTRAYAIRGFPSLILESSDEKYNLTHGYRTFDELKPEIDAWLA